MLGVLGVLNVFNVLNVLYVLNVLHVLNMCFMCFMDASLACWALFILPSVCLYPSVCLHNFPSFSLTLPVCLPFSQRICLAVGPTISHPQCIRLSVCLRASVSIRYL